VSRKQKGIAVAVIHVLLVCSLGAKLLIDRHRYPRVWVKTASYDPNLPIRGRYVSLQLEVELDPRFKFPDASSNSNYGWENVGGPARLEVHGAKLVAVADEGPGTQQIWRDPRNLNRVLWPQPVLFFIPEHATDPSRRPRGEELWAEVTIPKKGPPRPIQLAVKDAQGGWHPLDLR
jgi:hypothetical protein